MKKIHIITLAFILLGMVNMLSAQESDKKALDILENVSANMKAHPGFYVEYTFTFEDLADSTMKSFRGKMWYLNGNYKMDMMDQILFSDGTTNWVYQKEIQEVNISDFTEEETNSMIDPNALLENYATDYKCRFVSDRFINNRPLIEIHLFPSLLKESTYSRIKVKIDKNKNQLYEFTFVGKEGVNYSVTINKMDNKTSVTENMVHFNKSLFPNAEIIDMRD